MQDKTTLHNIDMLLTLLHEARPKGKLRVDFNQFNDKINENFSLSSLGLICRLYFYCKYLNRTPQDSILVFSNSYSKFISSKKELKFRTYFEKRGKFEFVTYTDAELTKGKWYILNREGLASLLADEEVSKLYAMKEEFLKNQI
jgi:hypothetical protein